MFLSRSSTFPPLRRALVLPGLAPSELAAWTVVVLLPLLLGAALYAAGEASLLRALRDWLSMVQGVDSWGPMERALELMRQPDRRAYLELFFEQRVKFQYPPTSLLLHELASQLGHPLTARGLNTFNWLLVWVYAGLCGVFAATLAARPTAGPGAGVRPVRAGLLAAAATVLCYPVLKAYVLGQAQLWIDVLFVLACLAWLGGRKAACGVLLGCICLLKPQFSVFLLWGALRSQWRMVGAWAATVAAGGCVSVALFGLQNHLDYLQVLAALSSTGEAYYPNQSVNGLLNRLLGTAPATVWDGHGFPPRHALVHAGTLASSLALLGGALLYRRREPPGILDFVGAALVFTMASPIAWEHHYGVLPPVLAVLALAILAEPPSPGRRLRLALLGACSVLGGALLGPAFRADAGMATLPGAYLYVAALGLLVLVAGAASRTSSNPA